MRPTGTVGPRALMGPMKYQEGGWSVSTVPLPTARFFRIFPDLAGIGPRDPFQRVRGRRGINFAVIDVPNGRIWTPLRPGIPATSGGQSLYTTPPLSLARGLHWLGLHRRRHRRRRPLGLGAWVPWALPAYRAP